MTNNKKNKQKQAPKKNKAGATKSKTPFSDAGAIAGSKLGAMFNAPYLKGVGKWLGSGIGQIFGSGDYTMIGGSPGYNVLMNGAQIPQFKTGDATNVICHREYLGDISGTDVFTNRQYPLNPGMAETFPWLSTIAQNYQQYRFHGIIFEFRPLITDFVTSGAPGVIVMATNYSADDIAYSTKQEMENSEFAVSVKPTRELIHGIECASNQSVLDKLYVRTGAQASNLDLRFTDLGKFQLASQSNPLQNLGELWVSYCVEFFKPKLPNDVGGNVLSFYSRRTSTTAAAPLGAVLGSRRGDLNVTLTGVEMAFVGQPGNYYLISVQYVGNVAAAITYPIVTVTSNCSFVNFFNTGSSTAAPALGTSATTGMQEIMIRCDNPDMLLNWGVAGVLPTGSASTEIVVTQMSSEAIP